MKFLPAKITHGLARLSDYFVALGPFGLFTVSLLDSAFVPLPSTADLLMPFPLKLFVISAGVFRFSVMRFTLAILVGRMFRFSLEGYLAIRYGPQARQLFTRYYPWIGLSLVVLIIVFFVTRNLVKAKPGRPGESLEPGE